MEKREKGIDYVLQKSMKRKVEGLADIAPLQSHTICLDNRSTNVTVQNLQEKRKRLKLDRKHKWVSFSTRAFRKKNQQLKKSSITYEKFSPISSLWDEYASRVANNESSVIKMDYHGANITVTSSPDPGLVGLSGRIVKETYGTLIIISEDNKMRQVNKNHTLIDVHTPTGDYEVNLSTIRCKPYLKASKKRKQRTPIDLPF